MARTHFLFILSLVCLGIVCLCYSPSWRAQSAGRRSETAALTSTADCGCGRGSRIESVAFAQEAPQLPENCMAKPPSAFINDAGSTLLDIFTLGIDRLAGFKGLGYDVIDVDGHLFGQVTEFPGLSDDGDINIMVAPLDVKEFEKANPRLQIDPPILSNVGLDTDADKNNKQVECEICDKCIDLIGSRIPIPGDFVQVDGLHVHDNGHGSKTEIHPVRHVRILEGGPSKPNAHAETFRLAVGAGGTCPDYSFARVTTPSSQSKVTNIHLAWPPPPAPMANVTMVPTLEVTNASPGRVGQPLQAFTLVTQPLVQGTFDGSAFTVHRSGDTVTMDLTMRADAGGFAKQSKIYDVKTGWAPLDVHLIVDPVADHHIIKSGVPFPRRRYHLSAHADLTGVAVAAFPAAQIRWLLHETNTTYSPGVQKATGLTVAFDYDIAPSHGLDHYELMLELQLPPPTGTTTPISMYAPIHIPRPYVNWRESARTDSCVMQAGGMAHKVSDTLEGSALNFASGPKFEWKIEPFPVNPKSQPAITATTNPLSHDFFVSKTTPANYYRVTLKASDLDGVESEEETEALSFIPVVRIVCRPVPGGAFKNRLSVEALGACGKLTYKWGNGATTPTIDVAVPIQDPVTMEVQITDEAGQSTGVRQSVCGRAIDEARRLKFFESVDALRGMMALNKLDIAGGPGGPNPDPVGGFDDLMKRWVLTASSTPPDVLEQRTAFLDKLVTQTKDLKGDAQTAALKTALPQAVQNVRGGQFKETLTRNVQVQNVRWNANNMSEMRRAAPEMLKSDVLRGGPLRP